MTMSVKLPTQPPIPRDVAASFAAAAAKDDKEAKQATNGKSTDAGKAEGSIPKAPFVAPAGVDPVAVPAFPPAMTGFMQGAKFPLPQVGANPFAPAAGFPPMAVPPPQSGPAGAQPGVAGTAQWNAMLQYYAYYSYLLCNGATGAAPADGAAPPRLAPPPLVDMSAWRQGMPGGAGMPPMMAGMGVPPGMPGAPGMAPGMTAAHMQSMAAIVAAMGAGQHAMAAAAAAMAAPHAGKKDGGKKRERGIMGSDSGDDASDSGGSASSKRGKKRGANGGETKTCVNCGVSRTPFWRKERVGGGSLCNACGLYLAKNDAPRPAMLWRRGGVQGESAAPGGGGAPTAVPTPAPTAVPTPAPTAVPTPAAAAPTTPAEAKPEEPPAKVETKEEEP